MADTGNVNVADLKARRASADWEDRYRALEQARQLPSGVRAEVAGLFLNDENPWVKSLAAQLVTQPGAPARRSRRGIVREVDQILHGAHLSFDQRWKLIRLFEEVEESGSTAQLGLAVDRAARLVTAALSEPARADVHLHQLDEFLRHVATYVRPMPVSSDSGPLADVVRKALSAFALDASLPAPRDVSVRADALDRALRELAQNALDAGSGHIDVRDDSVNGQVLVEVKNNGPVLTRVDADALFRPWFTTRVGHAGLGLYLARAAVTEAGGSIVLASLSPVAFEITLPH